MYCSLRSTHFSKCTQKSRKAQLKALENTQGYALCEVYFPIHISVKAFIAVNL